MIELFEQQIVTPQRHSSKGNQLKWKSEDYWYKADYSGYEGLAEYMVSQLIKHSNLKPEEVVVYELEQIRYKNRTFNGVKSKDMLEGNWQIITLERLFKNNFNTSLYQSVWKIHDVRERIEFLCQQVKRITGISDFGIYLTKLLEIDAVFKNEDRHMHNIAVLMNSAGEYKLCPIFDNGASLLSDTTLDYPLTGDIYTLMDQVKSKTVSENFDEQMDAAEELFGECIHFNFTKRDVDKLLEGACIYSPEIIERVRTVLYQQIRKYGI